MTMEERDYENMRIPGCRLEPDPLGAADLTPFLGEPADLPEQYIVPLIGHWFDVRFRPIPEKVWTMPDGSPLVVNQEWLDRCVGEAYALQKTSHEGVQISAKDAWAVTKEIDAERGHPKEAYGASAWAGADALIRGVASERLVPSGVGNMTRAQHLDQSWVNDAVRSERRKYAGERAYYVPRTEIRQALFKTGHPVATSCRWFTGDNDIGRGGRSPFMGWPSGNDVGGHMFATAGWLVWDGVPSLLCLNSWGKHWGWHGMFLIPLEGVMNRLGNGYVHIDKQDASLADLLARYDGKDVSLVGTPHLYRCELGVLRRYPDEIVWWAHGKLFGFDTHDIAPEDFARIPKGPDMRIEDAPAKSRELVRQIRQMYGQL